MVRKHLLDGRKFHFFMIMERSDFVAILVTLVVVGATVTTAGIAVAGAESAPAENDQQQINPDIQGSLQQSISAEQTPIQREPKQANLVPYVEYTLINTSSEVVYELATGSSLSNLGVPAGTYQVKKTEVTEEGKQTSEFTIQVADDGSITRTTSEGSVSTTATSSDVEVRATIGIGHDDNYPADGTVNISVAAVNTSSSVPEPVGDINLTVTIEGPNQYSDSRSIVTNADGPTTVPFDLSGKANGSYDVQVKAPSGETEYESFTAGPRVAVYPRFTDQIEVGQPATVAAVLTERGDPIPNEEVNITIYKPDGASEVRTLTTDKEGFVTFQFTPSQEGHYTLSPTSRPGEGTWLTASDTLAQLRTNDGEYSAHLAAGKSVKLSGYLMDEKRPDTNREVVVRIFNTTDDYEGVPVTNISTTTDAFGQYVASWQTPNKPGTDFEARLYTPNGSRIPHDGGRINLQSSGGEYQPPPADIDVELHAPGWEGIVAPGSAVNATISATENGSAVPDQTIEYALVYGYDGTVETTGTVTTNATGEKTVSLPVPQNAPDGADFTLQVIGTINGTEVEEEGYGTLQQYRIDEERLGSTRAGETATYELRFTDPATGDGFSGVSMTISGEADNRLQGGVFETGADVSNSTGYASVSVTVPNGISNEFLYGPQYPYFDGGFPTFESQGYPVTVNNVEDREYQAGETVTFNYTADTPGNTSAFVMLETWEDGLEPVPVLKRAEEGQNISITIPSVSQDVYYRAQLRTINETGVTSSKSEYLRVNGTGEENSAPIADAGTALTVAEGNTTELDGSNSYDPDGDSLSYSWTQTGGPAVTLHDAQTPNPRFTAPSVDANTTLTFELTVSDGKATDSDTVTVSVINTTDDETDTTNVTGRIVYPDKSTHANDTVAVFNRDSGAAALTDADGNFTIDAPAADSLNAAFYQGDYWYNFNQSKSLAPRDGVPDVYAVQTVNTSTSPTSLQNVSIPDGHVVNVTVLNESESPVKNATIDVRHASDDAQAYIGNIRTDENGQLHLGVDLQMDASVPPGIELRGDVNISVRPPDSGEYTNQTYYRNLTVTGEENLTVTLEEPDPGDTSVSVQPSTAKTPRNTTKTFEVVVDSANGGVGAVESQVLLSNNSVGQITNISLKGEPGLSNVTIADDGSSAYFDGALMDTPDSGSVTIATVTVRGNSAGDTAVDLQIEALGNESGVAYTVTEVNSADLTVRSVETLRSGYSGPPQDADGDGVFEDINGDGNVDIVDLQALYVVRHDEIVQQNTGSFDINDDGVVDIVDIQRLYYEMEGQ